MKENFGEYNSNENSNISKKIKSVDQSKKKNGRKCNSTLEPLQEAVRWATNDKCKLQRIKWRIAKGQFLSLCAALEPWIPTAKVREISVYN